MNRWYSLIFIFIISILITLTTSLKLTITQENNEKIINLNEIILFQNTTEFHARININITIEFSDKYILSPNNCFDGNLDTMCHNGEIQNGVFAVVESSPKLILNTYDIAFNIIKIINRKSNLDRILNASLVVTDNDKIVFETKFNEIQSVYIFNIDKDKINHLMDKIIHITFPLTNMKRKIYYNLSPGWPGFWKHVEMGYWELNTFKIFSECITNNITVIDIGAWIGPTTLYALSLTTKPIISLEPDVIAYNILKNNILLNDHDNNILLPNCISNIEENITMYSKDGLGQSISMVNRNISMDNNISNDIISCLTIQQVINQYHLSPPYFIKIDTEGFESEIIPAWYDWIPMIKPTIFVSMHRQLKVFTEDELINMVNVFNLFPYLYMVENYSDCEYGIIHINFQLTSQYLCESCDYLGSFTPISLPHCTIVLKTHENLIISNDY